MSQKMGWSFRTTGTALRSYGSLPERAAHSKFASDCWTRLSRARCLCTNKSFLIASSLVMECLRGSLFAAMNARSSMCDKKTRHQAGGLFDPSSGDRPLADAHRGGRKTVGTWLSRNPALVKLEASVLPAMGHCPMGTCRQLAFPPGWCGAVHRREGHAALHAELPTRVRRRSLPKQCSKFWMATNNRSSSLIVLSVRKEFVAAMMKSKRRNQTLQRSE